MTTASGTTQFQLDGFWYFDYKDYQAFLFTGVSGVVVNADSDNYGIEAQVQSSPGEGWDFVFGMAWMDPTVKDVPLRIGSPLPPEDVSPNLRSEIPGIRPGALRLGCI